MGTHLHQVLRDLHLLVRTDDHYVLNLPPSTRTEKQRVRGARVGCRTGERFQISSLNGTFQEAEVQGMAGRGNVVFPFIACVRVDRRVNVAVVWD